MKVHHYVTQIDQLSELSDESLVTRLLGHWRRTESRSRTRSWSPYRPGRSGGSLPPIHIERVMKVFRQTGSG